MEPDKIKALLAVSEENLDQAARRLQLPLPVAHSIRLQAMNLLLGKCCLCGKHAPAGVCGDCSERPITGRFIPWSGPELLAKLNPQDQLFSRVCVACKKSFALSVRYLLQLQSNNYRDRKLCRDCVGRVRKPVPVVEAKIAPAASVEVPEAAPEVEEQQRLERVARIEREKARQVQVRERRARGPAPRGPTQNVWKDRESPETGHKPFATSEAVQRLSEDLKNEAPKGVIPQTQP